MMIRTFFLLLVGATLLARASDVITAPMEGASASVTQPHVTAELIPEKTTIEPGQPFDIALHLHSDPGWHTYWINPGDAGLATSITWTLPPGFTAGPIQWPTPEKHAMGPLMTYGYAGDVYLLTTITPPASDLPRHFDIKAHAAWLVCEEECIPGKADLSLTLDTGSMNLHLPIENTDFFAAAHERLPVASAGWDIEGSYQTVGTTPVLTIKLQNESGADIPSGAHSFFFVEQSNVLGQQEGIVATPQHGTVITVPLQQNGEKPDKLSGVFVSDQPLIGNAKSVYLSEFPVSSVVAADVPIGGSVSPSDDSDGGHRPPLQTETAPPLGTAAATSAVPSAQPWLIAVLGAAFIGGLILNLMPCVLPVLSLKVFSLMKHAGNDPRGAWKQGAAFTAGVVISFWVLAGLLLALRAAGNQLGWGFQMQSPGFVLALIFLFFLLGLNLFGVFELGTSLVGLDAKATGRSHGLLSSFLNGALATAAATPCTAPFMGSSLGFAAQQPPFIAMLIFTFLALGMAAPYLLLTIFPGALRFVPKPGAWMEAFKQFMGFLLMATVIFLIYVFGALVGDGQIFELLFGLLFVAMGGWLYGDRQRSSSARWPSALFVFVFMFTGLGTGVDALMGPIPSHGSHEKVTESKKEDHGWQPWSPDAVQAALAQDRPVFVDFTAAWCLSCKVNERVALDTDGVQKAFAEKNVVLLRADWTHADPAISETLRQYNRDGVPLYLLYSPKNKTAPQVLPEVLTPGIVFEALDRL